MNSKISAREINIKKGKSKERSSNISPKMNNLVIYSPSCHTKPV